MSIRYNIANQQTLVPTYVCRGSLGPESRRSAKACPAGLSNQAISDLLLDLMQPMTLLGCHCSSAGG